MFPRADRRCLHVLSAEEAYALRDRDRSRSIQRTEPFWPGAMKVVNEIRAKGKGRVKVIHVEKEWSVERDDAPMPIEEL